MKAYQKIFALFTFLACVFSAYPAVAQTQEYTDISQVVRELNMLDPYVSYTDDTGFKLQTFDTAAALRDGFSREIVLLAEEIIAFQNDLVIVAHTDEKKQDITEQDVSLDQYPRVMEFFENASQLAKDNGRGLLNPPPPGAHPCGDYVYPVPNWTPSWSFFSSPNPEQALLSLGYHHTADYACSGRNCHGIDFTKGRSYSGPNGFCSSPRFRNQGRIESSSAYKIQYGEPNPEITSYSWPYTGWGAYVYWWHRNF